MTPVTLSKDAEHFFTLRFNSFQLNACAVVVVLRFIEGALRRCASGRQAVRNSLERKGWRHKSTLKSGHIDHSFIHFGLTRVVQLGQKFVSDDCRHSSEAQVAARVDVLALTAAMTLLTFSPK